MHDQQLHARIARSPVFPFRFYQCFVWIATVSPLMIAISRCGPGQIQGIADIGPILGPFMCGVATAVSLLIFQHFYLQGRVADTKKAIDGLKSIVNVESVRIALDIAISVLDDPAPGRIDLAKRVLTNVMADLPKPPASQSDIQE